MTELLQASELLAAAIRIEKNGEAFYRGIGNKLTDAKTREIFDYLKREEERHAEIFSEILLRAGTFVPDGESYPGEYREYLKTFADHNIFNRINTGRLSAVRMTSPEDIFNFAIRMELESMVFYRDIKQYVPQTQVEAIDGIIAEEQSHYATLITLQSKLTKNNNSKEDSDVEVAMHGMQLYI